MTRKNFPKTFDTINALSFESNPSPFQQAIIQDLISYEILFQEGGLYSDLDYLFFKPTLNLFRQYKLVLVGCDSPNNRVCRNNAFFGAVAGN